jgi:hypothetical protein
MVRGVGELQALLLVAVVGDAAFRCWSCGKLLTLTSREPDVAGVVARPVVGRLCSVGGTAADVFQLVHVSFPLGFGERFAGGFES